MQHAPDDVLLQVCSPGGICAQGLNEKGVLYPIICFCLVWSLIMTIALCVTLLVHACLFSPSLTVCLSALVLAQNCVAIRPFPEFHLPSCDYQVEIHCSDMSFADASIGGARSSWSGVNGDACSPCSQPNF